MTAESKPVQVVVTCGPQDAKRLMTGLSLAVAAAAAGTTVYVFFTMDGVQCLEPEVCGRVLLKGYPPVRDLLSVIHETGGRVEYCPNCLPAGCHGRLAQPANGGESACGCVGLPAGLASFGVRLADCPTVII